MKLTWLGHSAFRVEIGTSTILIDPFLKGNPSFKGKFAEVTKDVTHILLTHGHDDHVGDAAEIGAKVNNKKQRLQPLLELRRAIRAAPLNAAASL